MKKRADLGWAVLASYIIAYDLWAMVEGRETLSESFVRHLRHPFRKPFVVFAGIATIKHLYFPELLKKYDPFGILAFAVRVVFRLDQDADGLSSSVLEPTPDLRGFQPS